MEVWDSISASCVGDPVKIYGIVNLEKYNRILIHHVVPSGMFLTDNGLILQHHNDPNAVKACLDRKTQSSLPRPQHHRSSVGSQRKEQKVPSIQKEL